MQKLSLLSALGLAAGLAAQSPCVATTHVETTFSATHYLGLPAGVVRGFGQMFDLTNNAPVSITAMSGHVYEIVLNNIGQPVTATLYTCPSTWTGNEFNLAAWTPVGTATGIVNGFGTPTTVTFNTPVNLAPGTRGVILEWGLVTTGPNPGPLNPLVQLVGATAPYVDGDQFMTIANQAIVREAFTQGLFASSATLGYCHLNMGIDYTTPSNAAFSTEYGDGCYKTPKSYYESFEATTPFDLSNSSLTHVFAGTFYTCVHTPVAPAWFTPTSANLALGAYGTSSTTSWDDAISTPITLPFTFPYPGGTTTSIEIGSNGFVQLAPWTGTSDPNYAYYNNRPYLLSGSPRLAAYFGDLDLSTSGSLHYDVDPSNNQVYITWLNVQEWNATPNPAWVASFQIMLDSSGLVEYRFLSCTRGPAEVCTGWSPGGNAVDPLNMDISARVSFQTGNDELPPHLHLSARPRMGQQTHVLVDDIRTGVLAGGLVLGFNYVTPGLDLTSVGMPGCFLHTGVADLIPFPVTVPGAGSLAGTEAYLQVFMAYPQINIVGAINSNGLCVRLNPL
jgi:hypothetical protein